MPVQAFGESQTFGLGLRQACMSEEVKLIYPSHQNKTLIQKALKHPSQVWHGIQVQPQCHPLALPAQRQRIK